MNDKAFGAQLKREMPRWQAQGWISAEGGQAILEEIEKRQPKMLWASSLALAGALLLGVGVITWFAAHWTEMSKLLKLILIGAALTGAHLAHGLCLTRHQLPKLAHGMALLSVLFFGAAIMLIGQIYHIDAHFPNGIALWAAGGLLTAWLLASQPALVASIALAIVWTWIEQFDYRTMNWPTLIYLALAALPLLRHDWKIAARGWGVLFILWVLGWHLQPWAGDGWSAGAHVRLLALQVMGITGLWAIAHTVSRPTDDTTVGGRLPPGAQDFARAVRGDFLLAALIGAFAFTFPDIAPRLPRQTMNLAPWLAGLTAAGAIYTIGILRLARTSPLPPQRLQIGIALGVGLAVLLATEVLAPRGGTGIALLWNALFLALLYWIGDLGIRHGDRALLNRAFIGFAIWVLARYFDTFWSLLDRSLFFMAGGLLLLAGGGWLERRRRSLLRTMHEGSAP